MKTNKIMLITSSHETPYPSPSMGYIGMWVDLGDGPKESGYKSRRGGCAWPGEKVCSEAKKTDASEKDGCLLCLSEPSSAGSEQKPRPVICISPFPLSPSFPFPIKKCKAYYIACHNLLYT